MLNPFFNTLLTNPDIHYIFYSDRIQRCLLNFAVFLLHRAFHCEIRNDSYAVGVQRLDDKTACAIKINQNSLLGIIVNAAVNVAGV